MQTKYEFMEEAKQEIGENDFKGLYGALDSEYYTMIESHVKQGNKITNAVYESLSEGQRWHFNKHYNYRMDKIETNEVIEQLEVNETIEAIGEVSFQTEEAETIVNDTIELVINEVIETTQVTTQVTKKVSEPKKIRKMKKKQIFYWFDYKENNFIEAYGDQINIEGYNCFILENDDKTYSIVEGRTGSFFCSHIKFKKAAIELAEENIIKFSDKMDELIQNSIDKIGYSPLYKQSEAV